MKIFRISCDVNFQQLFPVEEDFFRKYDFNGNALQETWEVPTFYINDPLIERGDFLHITPSILCFSEKVYNSQVGNILGGTGEILEIKVEGESETFYILNPLIRYNCLNHNELEYRNPFAKIFPMITKFSFHSKRIGDSSIFKLPDGPSVPTLCYQSIDCENFYDLYHEQSFRGLKFTEIWSEG